MILINKRLFLQKKMEEIFEKINGMEYYISKLGNIKTYNWKNNKREAILRPALSKKGYLKVGLQVNGVLHSYSLHRLVALQFIPNIFNKPQINHKNGIKTDNRVENLEWCTNKENQIHAVKNGLVKSKKGIKRGSLKWTIGENNINSILTEKEVLEIRAKFRPRIYTREMLGKEYNVTPATIKDVILRKSWRHI